MFESTPEQLAYHKLLILYTLKKIEQGLTGWQLNQVLLEKDLMNYFSIQTNLNQLIESKLVKLYTKSEIDYYALTQLGLETLESFMNRIPEDIRQLIDDYIDDNEYNWLSESYLKAESEYIRKNDQEYLVNLRISKNNLSLVNLNLTLSSELDAIKSCNNWEEKSKEIFSSLMDSLLK